MTKLKERSVNSKENFKSCSSTIVKAKHLETSAERMIKPKSPGPLFQKTSEMKKTRFQSKCNSKNTSTPAIVTLQSKTMEQDLFYHYGASGCRTALSPIVLDAENVRCGEIQNKLLTSKRSSPSKVDKENNNEKSLTKRRTVGKRRLFSVADGKDERNISIDSVSQKLRVQLQPNQLNPVEQSIGYASKEIQSKEESAENSLVRQLRNEWSNSTLSETPQCKSPINAFKKQPLLPITRHLDHLKHFGQGNGSASRENSSKEESDVHKYSSQESSLVRNLRSVRSKSYLNETGVKAAPSQRTSKRQPRVRIKRQLSTLFEGLVNESIATTKSNSKTKQCDDTHYSSSAEFESDDDKENCALKKAPTWKSLRTKFNDSTNTSSSKTHVRGPRRLSLLLYANISSDDDDNAPQNKMFIGSCKSLGNKHTSTTMKSPHLSQVADEIENNPAEKNYVSVSKSKSTVSEDANPLINKCRRDVRIPKVRLQRIRIDLEKMSNAPQSKGFESITAEVENGNVSAEDRLVATDDVSSISHIHGDVENMASTVSEDCHLSSNSRYPARKSDAVDTSKGPVNQDFEPVKPTPNEVLKGQFVKCRRDAHLKSNRHDIRIPKVRLRRFRTDLEKTRNAAQSNAGKDEVDCSLLSSDSQNPTRKSDILPDSLKLSQLVDKIGTSPTKRVSGSEETIENITNCPEVGHFKGKLPVTIRSPSLGIRRLRKDLHKIRHTLESNGSKDILAEVENIPPLRMSTELSIEPNSLQGPDTRFVGNQEPESQSENILSESFSLPSSLSTSERPPTSPIYDISDDDTTAVPNCTTNKFFTSRTYAAPAESKAIEIPEKRSSRKRKNEDNNIYDFFSQSSSEDIVPMSDIIQRMIKTGKVTVAKPKKGRGKLEIPRKRRKKEARKKVDLKKPQEQSQQKPAEIPIIDIDNDNESHFDDNQFVVHPSEEYGSFSRLARSTMIKQARRSGKTPQRKMITDRRKLLSLAKKIVGQSTPVKSAVEPTARVAQLSPIYSSASPWRGMDDNLPTTFYFGRDSNNLPSFSSDHIPMSQTENEAKSVSPYSSNDSDMENIAPPGAQESSRIETPSVPRRGLSKRSPLKSINIIEVVNLPPLVFDNTAKEISKENNRSISTATDERTSCPNKTVQNETNADKITHEEISHDGKVNLFGFEDIIDEESDSPEASLNVTKIPTKENLKEKLHRLKRLRPQIPSPSVSKPQPIKAVFDGPRTRQKNLKQMFCSTMIEKQGCVGQERAECDGFFNDGYDGDLTNLFKDPEPETTFNESDTRRTYSRLYKTKRRKVRNNFVMFMDSDASEDEEEEHKADTRTKKRQKKEANVNAKELNKFADEFNEMCKEVSQYQLIVE